ncbi:MAG: EamA family transporter [Actinomycetota bacterium]
MLGIMLALVSSLGYGCADFAGGLASRGAHVLRVAAIGAPAGLAVQLLLLPVAGGHWSGAAVGWGVASGLASSVSIALLNQSLAIGPMSVVSPVTAVVSALLPVTAGVLAGERLTAAGIVGIALALAAVIAISTGGAEGQTGRPAPRALVMATGAGLAIGAQLVCLHQSPADSGIVPILVGRVVSAVILLTAFVLYRTARTSGPPAGRGSLGLAFGGGALDTLANVAFLLASRHGALAVLAVIVALYPGGTVLLARATFGERLTRAQAAGLAGGAVAVALLALA